MTVRICCFWLLKLYFRKLIIYELNNYTVYEIDSKPTALQNYIRNNEILVVYCLFCTLNFLIF